MSTGLNFKDEMEYQAAGLELLAASEKMTEEECQQFEMDILLAVFEQLGPRKKKELDLSNVREAIALRRFMEN